MTELSQFDYCDLPALRYWIMRANKIGLKGRRIKSITVVHSTDPTVGTPNPLCIFELEDV